MNLTYIENCIQRILWAKCHPGRAKARIMDIAESIERAATAAGNGGTPSEGVNAAHRWLMQVLDRAEGGYYAKESTR